MKSFKLMYLAVIGLFTFSFSIASNSRLFKKRIAITNCYSTLSTGEWLQTCSLTPVYQPINKANYPAEVNKIVRNNLSVSGYIASPASKNCSGGNILCCIQFASAGTADPCSSTTDELRAPASPNQLKNDLGNSITANDYVKIVDVFFHP